MKYPVTLTQEDGVFLVSFPDVPEALTSGDTKEEALIEGLDALIAALGSYIYLKEPIPKPSPARGSPTVNLNALTSAKIGLYSAMLESGTTNVALAKELGVTEAIVRRLINLDHRSHISQVERALSALGKKVIVSIQAA